MSDYEPLLKNIARYITLTDEETEYFLSLLKVKHVRKKQFIVQPDFTCRYRSYVVSGAMRAYLVDCKDQENTIAFAVEDWWISDFYSYINQEPATQFVEALEDSVLLQLEFDAEEQLLARIPKFERYFKVLAQRALANLQKRMLSNLSLTAEKRYEQYMDKHAAIAARVPQYALASYLGMTTEFLSKIRRKQLHKKLN